MVIIPFKTRTLQPPQDNLDDIWDLLIPTLKEKSVVAVTSKIISISEGRCLPKDSVPIKDELIIKESEFYLPRENTPGGWLMHTIKNNLLIGTAGIDESNGNNYYILWPENPKLSAQKILDLLKQKADIKELGVIITDSHSVPLRRGVVGISLACAGFNPLYDYRGSQDIFGRSLTMEQTNIPDALAAAAVLTMGEGAEQTPIAIISDIPNIVFNPAQSEQKPFSSFEVPIEEDLFRPFLKSVPWKKGKV